MYRIFLDWNTGGSVYVSWLLDASLFSFWWHVLTSCVISNLLYFKAGTWLPWIQAVHFTSECEYGVECWFALPRMLFPTLHWPSWACFTHFSMIHQLRFMALQQLFFLSNVVLLFLGISQHLIQITYYGHGNSRQYNVGVFKSTGLGVTLRLGFWFFYFFLYYLDKMISLTWPWFLKLG